MILTSIALNNFGTYAGSQSVSLAPRPGKNIILFGGKNGAGKSTLLEAVRLCFYGQHAAKELQVPESYDKYLLSRIHTDPAAVIQPSTAGVEVNFDYSENGYVETYSVLRSWERRNGSRRVTEAFILKRNGEIVKDLDSEHWQDFIRDLVPSGISQLFFFDGEKIQHLAEDETDQLSLGESIKALLGLDIIERLQADLTIYKSRNLKSLEVAGSDKLEELVNSIEQLRTQLATISSERNVASDNIKTLRININEVEQAVTVRGGGFSKNRERLQKRRTELKTRVEIHEQTIREIAGTMLPFSIAMPLCHELIGQLEREEELDANRALKNKLAKIRADFSVLISRPKLWKSLGVTAPVRGSNIVLSELDDVLSSALRGSKTRAIHKVSASDREQMIAWIEEAGRLKPVLQRISSELEQFYRELQKCERELGRVPSDEILRPYLDQLSELNTRLGQSTAEFAMHEERARIVNSELDEMQRKLDRQMEEVAGRAKGALNLHRASTIHVVLDEYRTVLMRKKVEQLEGAISDCFNVLSRKKDTLRTLRIDPSDFSVQLMDRNQRPLKKSELSAGEKQIFAVAVLWGLAKVSGKPLPMIVDTPLARLDSDHRRLLAENYFPHASHQVIVLSTDTEIDRKYFDLMHEHVSHSYTLEYSSQVNGTIVKEGYFGNEVN